VNKNLQKIFPRAEKQRIFVTLIEARNVDNLDKVCCRIT
jgi:hypothetical protein